MKDTAVMYTGATTVFSEFAVQFYNALELEAGGMLEVRHPQAFENFFCDSFQQVSLPGEVACETSTAEDAYPAFRLAFNHTVAPGDYSFSILAGIPSDIPDETEFSILLIDRHGHVQD